MAICLPQQSASAQVPTGDAAASAGVEAARLAAQHVEASLSAQRLDAGNKFLSRSLHRLKAIVTRDSPEEALFDSIQSLDSPTRQSFARLLQDGAEPAAKALEAAAEDLQRRADQASATWLGLRTAILQRRFLLFEVDASRRVAAQLASLLSVDKQWFWLFGVVALSTLAAMVFHERRHELRRLFNGGRARALGLSKVLAIAVFVLAGITVAVFFMGDRIYESLVGLGSGEAEVPRQAILAQHHELAARVASLAQQRRLLEGQWRTLEAQWGQRLADRLPAGSQIASASGRFRAAAVAATEAAAVLQWLPQAIAADVAELEKLDRDLNAQSEATARYLRLRQWIRGGLGLALLGVTLAGGVSFRRAVKARRQRTAETCPLCLAEGYLEPVLDRAGSDGASEDVLLVQCKNVVSEQPYEACDYTFMEAYRPMTKLCLPTLGVPQAGKTHWLAMLYWELNRGNYPRSIQFEKIKSQSSQDFDRIVEEILNSRLGTAATQRDRIPHPLVFHFQDRDRWGRSSVLVNIFDYSGEVTLDMGVEDYRRRRALDGDGFLFFLDPTYPSDPQAKALADFREDLRLVKGIKTGRRIGIPVALCVSKIDMLSCQPYTSSGSGDVVHRFYDELAQIDPTGEAMSLAVIEARSRLISRLRETIWPGWHIERQVDDLFGGRYLFFPLTPVGLDGLGETDLSLRTICPFGLLEPLLWLLEMNGYPVLDR